jgi:hypothetical protein
MVFTVEERDAVRRRSVTAELERTDEALAERLRPALEELAH